MLSTASTSDVPKTDLVADTAAPGAAASDLSPAQAEGTPVSGAVNPAEGQSPPTPAVGTDWSLWRPSNERMAVLGGIAAITLWSYWTTLERLEARWSAEAEHSHGYIVPVISLFLLYLRSENFDPRKWKGSGWGLPLIGLALVMRLVGERYLILGLHPLSLIPCLAGIFLTLGGLGALQWAGPSIFFLLFMIPLPNSIEQLLSVPLKGYSAVLASWILQIIGFPAVTQGTTLKIDDVRLEIVDACSGMNLLMTMSATVVAYTLIVQRPLIHKLLLLAAVLPIAVISNAFRIAATGILMKLTTSEEAHKLAHDWAGYVIQMPLALIMIALFSAYLSRVLSTNPAPAEDSSDT